MRTDLKVPYEEKDVAKRLGARWDGDRKTWYVQDVQNIAKFIRWLPENRKHLLRPHGKNKKRPRLDNLSKDQALHLREVIHGI